MEHPLRLLGDSRMFALRKSNNWLTLQPAVTVPNVTSHRTDFQNIPEQILFKHTPKDKAKERQGAKG